MPPGDRRPSAKLERQRETRAQEQEIRNAAASYRDKLKRGIRTSIRDHALKQGVSYQRLYNYLHGRLQRSDVDAAKSSLGPAESQQLVDWLIAQAERGFPLTDHQIEELANHLIRKFHDPGPDWEGVGKDWVFRFRQRHEEQLSRYWSKSLDASRANGLSPAHVEHWFALLSETILDGAIPPKRIFAMDESGLQISVLMRRMVTGGKTGSGSKKKVQHAQSGSNRELVSVIATICADGTATTPAVIFQGKNLMAPWVANNPLQAHIGMSAKGYNNRVIGLAWIEQFERETRDKAPNGEKRLLIVDGHGSHYTIEALEFARAHNIDILAYPPHTTHALQGLDVVMFAPLKRAYSEAVRKYEDETGERATKACFLSLFEGPWRQTFTPSLIRDAFRKTGVWPLDPSVIQLEQMQPAVANSIQPGFGPRTPSPVRAIMQALTGQSPRPAAAAPAVDPALLDIPVTPERQTGSMHVITPHHAQAARASLRGTSAAFLLRDDVVPEDKLPSPSIRAPEPLSPDWHLADAVPGESPKSAALRSALRQARKRNTAQKHMLLAAQTSMALQGLRLKQLSKRLATRSKKRKDIQSIIFKSGDGVLLTNDACTGIVRDAQEKRAQAAQDRLQRKSAREARRKASDAEKLHKQQVREKYKQEMVQWRAECAAIRAAHPNKKRGLHLPQQPRNPLYARRKPKKASQDHDESSPEDTEMEESSDDDDPAESSDDAMDIDLVQTDDEDVDWDDVE